MPPWPVQHHFADLRLGEERLERSEPGDLVGQLAQQMLESRRGEDGRLVVQQLGEPGADGEGTPGPVVLVEVIDRVEAAGGDEGDGGRAA